MVISKISKVSENCLKTSFNFTTVVAKLDLKIYKLNILRLKYDKC